jgi:hypothetical protein
MTTDEQRKAASDADEHEAQLKKIANAQRKAAGKPSGRKVHRNTDFRQPDGPTRTSRPNARAKADVEWYRTHPHSEERECPRAVVVVLSTPELYKSRFTDFQWIVLVLSWVYGELQPGQRDWVSDYYPAASVARMLGEKPEAIQQARKAAEDQATHLVYVWQPAVRKWQRIKAGNPHNEKLTTDESKVLKRNKYPKKGRKTVNIPEPKPREVHEKSWEEPKVIPRPMGPDYRS